VRLLPFEVRHREKTRNDSQKNTFSRFFWENNENIIFLAVLALFSENARNTACSQL